MKSFAIPIDESSAKAVERQARQFISDWIGLLGSEQYEEALDWIVLEIPGSSGSVDSSEATEWTPQLLKAVIANYGTAERVEGQDRTYKVVPIDDELRPPFEAALHVDLSPFDTLGRHYLGEIQVDLPLDYPRGHAVGDLTARLLFRPVSSNEMALVLLDIHVL
jgi:hypothetical protein